MEPEFPEPILEILTFFESVRNSVDFRSEPQVFFLSEVIAEDNLGDWLTKRFPDPTKLHEACPETLLVNHAHH